MTRATALLFSLVLFFAVMSCERSPQGISDSGNLDVAANPHFIRGPTVTDIGTQARVSGTIAGLGNENVDVQVSAQGTAETTCTNPAGNIAPGQTKTVTVTGFVSNLESKNGRVTFTATTATPSPGRCPNNKWTGTVTDVTFSSVTVTVFQPAGTNNVVFSQTFSGPF